MCYPTSTLQAIYSFVVSLAHNNIGSAPQLKALPTSCPYLISTPTYTYFKFLK